MSGRVRGRMRRGTCPGCGVDDIPITASGKPMVHGPYGNRCTGEPRPARVVPVRAEFRLGVPAAERLPLQPREGRRPA